MNDNITGKRLRKLRKERGLTGEQLGEILGYTKTAVSYWENGRVKMDHETLVKVADFFNVSVDYLLGREKTDMERLEENLARLDPRIKQAYHSLQDMDEEDLNFTLELIKMIEAKKKKG